MALSKAKLFAHRFPHISIATKSKLVTWCFYIPKKNPWNPHVWLWNHRLRRDIEIIIPLRMMFLPTPKKNSNFIKTTWSNGEKMAFSRFISPKYPYDFSWISSISIFFMVHPMMVKAKFGWINPYFRCQFPPWVFRQPLPLGTSIHRWRRQPNRWLQWSRA